MSADMMSWISGKPVPRGPVKRVPRPIRRHSLFEAGAKSQSGGPDRGLDPQRSTRRVQCKPATPGQDLFWLKAVGEVSCCVYPCLMRSVRQEAPWRAVGLLGESAAQVCALFPVVAHSSISCTTSCGEPGAKKCMFEPIIDATEFNMGQSVTCCRPNEISVLPCSPSVVSTSPSSRASIPPSRLAIPSSFSRNSSLTELSSLLPSRVPGV